MAKSNEELYSETLDAIHDVAVKLAGRAGEKDYVAKKANLIVSLARYKNGDTRTKQEKDE